MSSVGGDKYNLIASCHCFIILLLLCCFLCGIVKSAEAVSTNRVQRVQAIVLGDVHIPAGVRQRMEVSVGTIGNQLLEGKTIHDVSAGQGYYEGIIQQVFDKVLVGYSVSKVTIQPGNELKIFVNLVAWQDKIDSLSVETKVIGMPPVVEKLLLDDIQGIEQLFEGMLLELPVAASDWTNGVVKHTLNDFMSQRAPEFRADFDVVVDKNTKVVIEIYPLLPVVRTTDLSMRSDTFPNVALLTQRQDMQDGVDMFVGVPVAFVKRHQGYIQQLLERRLDDKAEAKAWGVHTNVTITPGERLAVMCRSNSKDYFLRFEGWADIGRSSEEGKDNSLRVRGLVGRQLSSQDGLFSVVEFFPQHVHWDWDVGYYRNILPGVRGNVRYDFKERYWKAGMKYDFAPKWSFLYEYRQQNSINEVAFRYKLHDFLSVAWVMDNHDYWLRFIGYF